MMNCDLIDMAGQMKLLFIFLSVNNSFIREPFGFETCSEITHWYSIYHVSERIILEFNKISNKVQLTLDIRDMYVYETQA